MTKRVQLLISTTGLVRTIYSDQACTVLRRLSSELDIRRASHVERIGDLRPIALAVLRQRYGTTPIPDEWWVDLLPSSGPVMGPYTTYDEAIQAELAWLYENHIPEVTNERHAHYDNCSSQPTS